MYSSNYTHVPRYTLEAQKKKQMQRSKGKSCGYYMRIIFFFSSLIQSLIIISLVLFLVYGKKQDSADTVRITDLEQSFSRVSMENVALQLQRKNLTKSLNLTITEKLKMDQELTGLRNLSIYSINVIKQLIHYVTQCGPKPGINCPKLPCKDCTECQRNLDHVNAMVHFLRATLNQTTLKHNIEIEQLTKERDDLSLEAIDLRKDKDQLEGEIDSYKRRCKQDFVASLNGISNVTRAFLEKIDSLFPRHISFQLTCEKQRENLEQIRSNCTNLSHEVENTFQRYLDSVSTQVSYTLNEITHLGALNKRLTKDYNSCRQNSTNMIQEHRHKLQKVTLRCDEDKKTLLIDKKKQFLEKEMLNSKIHIKDMEINNLMHQLRVYNTSCLPRNQFGIPFSLPGSTSNFNPGSIGSRLSISTTGSRLGPGTTSLNKPLTNGINGVNVDLTGSLGTFPGKKVTFPGVSLGNINLGNTNLGSTWPSSNGVGSTRSLGGAPSLGSILGSSATGLGKQSIGSIGSKVPGASSTSGSGTGLVKLGSPSTGLAGGLGLGNTGSVNIGLGISSLGRGTGNAGSFGGLGGGQTGGIVSVNILQHLQDLQRYANPSSTEKKN